jgi:hypothetical protein
MDSGNNAFRRTSLLHSPLTNSTSITRVKHTIEMLVQTESAIRSKLPIKTSGNNDTILTSITAQINELIWGWEDLEQTLLQESSDWFDRDMFISECNGSISRLRKLLTEVEATI